jgi:hypothetical protein
MGAEVSQKDKLAFEVWRGGETPADESTSKELGRAAGGVRMSPVAW